MCSVFVWNEVDIQGVRWKIGLWELWTQMPSTTLRYPTSPSAESSLATLNDWSVFAIFPVQERGIVLALALSALLWHKHKIWIQGDGAQWDRENEMRARRRSRGRGPFPLTRPLETVTVAWWQVSQIYESPRLLQVCCPSRPEEESWWTLWTLAFRNLWASLGTLMISQQDTQEPESALPPEGCKPAAFQILNKWALYLSVIPSCLSTSLILSECGLGKRVKPGCKACGQHLI